MKIPRCLVLIAYGLAFFSSAFAQTQRFELNDASGKALLVIDQEYLGKKLPAGMAKIAVDPDLEDVDFYRLTYTNLSGTTLIVKRFALGMRYGSATLHGVKSEQSESSFGAGLKEVDLIKQAMFESNHIPPGYKRGFFHWLRASRTPNFMDREITVEQNGVVYSAKWSMKYVKGTASRD